MILNCSCSLIAVQENILKTAAIDATMQLQKAQQAQYCGAIVVVDCNLELWPASNFHQAI